MLMCRLRTITCFFLVLFFVSAATLFGQGNLGTITGSVKDSSGAMVPGATVVAKNLATNSQYKTQTTSSGDYTVVSLPPGQYSLTVDQHGFKTYAQIGITVQVGQTQRQDVTLEVGATTQSVEVRADATMLKTDSTEGSTVYNVGRLDELPLNFTGVGLIRNPLEFANLAPGAVNDGWLQLRVNGMPSYSFKITLDGQDQTDKCDPRLLDESQPSLDAINEFALVSDNFSAEFGQISGGLFNLTTKSGTNQLHGAAYDYLANSMLNAETPFTHQKSATHQNDFGFNVGGPVVIPKLSSKRYRMGRASWEPIRWGDQSMTAPSMIPPPPGL